MAEKIDAYDFDAPVSTGKYPWDEWCDGSIWHAREGIDYTSSTNDFRNALKYRSAVRAMDVRIRLERDGVVFQFIPDRDSAEFVNRSANAEAKDI